MTPRLNFDDLTNILFENACEDFRKTNQYRLLYDKHNKMATAFENILSRVDNEFAEDYFNVLLELQAEEMEFIYRQGFRDCVAILKKLEVI